MENKIVKVLPKMLGGTVHQQFKKCGKATCKCARGELHGPYFYHYFRDGAVLSKRYLKASEVEEVRAACLARQKNEQQRRASDRVFWQKFRAFRTEMREPKTLGDLLSGGDHYEF